MEGKVICKVSYNGINKEGWIEDRDRGKSRRMSGGLLDINSLEKSGRNLQDDLKKNGMSSAPREFVKLGDIGGQLNGRKNSKG